MLKSTRSKKLSKNLLRISWPKANSNIFAPTLNTPRHTIPKIRGRFTSDVKKLTKPNAKMRIKSRQKLIKNYVKVTKVVSEEIVFSTTSTNL